MSRFVAIPVGRGDSFFYEDVNTSILVDGGINAERIATQFKTATSRSRLDILICTHNDADHANGVLGLLESGIQCQEVWLPGSWTRRLNDLLANPNNFYHEIYEDWFKARESIEEAGTLDTYGDILSMEQTPEEESEERTESTNDGALQDALKNAIASSKSNPIYSIFDLDPWPWIPYVPHGIKTLVDALEAADRIRKIALAAFQAGTTIRWFEYGRSKPLLHSNLMPLNCHEILKTRRSPAGALKSIALSTANKESLVFSVLPTEELPGIVFSADSDFGFPLDINPTSDYLVTAPHHGSESNSLAYIQLGPILNNGTIVRSDCNSSSRPGETFLKHPPNKRFCTICRGANRPKQALDFKGDVTGWHAMTTVRSCACR